MQNQNINDKRLEVSQERKRHRRVDCKSVKDPKRIQTTIARRLLGAASAAGKVVRVGLIYKTTLTMEKSLRAKIL